MIRCKMTMLPMAWINTAAPAYSGSLRSRDVAVPTGVAGCVSRSIGRLNRPAYSSSVLRLKIEKKKRDSSETATAEWFKGLEPKLLKIGAVTLAPSTEAGKSSGLTFHYPPYAVGPYVEGEYVAFVPWEALKQYLTPEGQRIFGGSRPKADEEDQQ